MANRDKPFGAVPVGTLDGSDWRGKLRRVQFAAADSVAAFIGDFVKLTGTTDATGKIPIVAQCATTDPSIGALVSLEPDFANESFSSIYRAASTKRNAMVVMDGGNILYEMQEDSDGNAIEILEAGLNANFVVGSGDTTTGISAMEIDSTSAANTAALDLRLHYVADKPDNELGDQAVWVVSLNTSQDRNTTGT